MRIIAGKYRGRRLIAPEGDRIRPTSDRLRERLFNILEHGRDENLTGAMVADIFAGSGALGIEALSRGAASVTFVETDREARQVIRANLSELGLTDQAEIIGSAANQLPAKAHAFDLVMLDPPYGRDLLGPALERLLKVGWIGPDTCVVAETERPGPSTLPPPLEIVDRRSQAQSEILFAKVATQ